MEPTAPHIYPPLPSMEIPQMPQQQFRLQEIARLKTYLETEAKMRESLKKRYRRGITATHAVDGVSTIAALGLGVGGVGLLTTIIAAPIVVGLEAAALASGLVGHGAKFIGARLAAKKQKHNKIRVLAMAR